MRIVIPDVKDSTLRILPPGPAEAVLEKIILGTSNANKPKATFKYTITKEIEGNDGEPTIGETVLETYSLQPQALFNLAGVYKMVTKEKLPMGDYDQEEFLEILESALCGSTWKLILETEVPIGAEEERTVIAKKTLA